MLFGSRWPCSTTSGAASAGKVSQIHLGATFLLGRKTIVPANNGFSMSSPYRAITY